MLCSIGSGHGDAMPVDSLQPSAQIPLSRPSPTGSQHPKHFWLIVCLGVTTLIAASVIVTAPPARPSLWHPGTPRTAPITTNTEWQPPVGDADVSSVLRGFDAPEKPWSPGHRGVDLASNDPVVAPADGIISFAGTVADRAVLTIEHANGMHSSFEPVDTELSIGDSVHTGEVIGEIQEGIDHCDQSCVHWGVRIPDSWHIGSTLRDRYIDPLLLVGWSGPSVLWPLESDPPRESALAPRSTFIDRLSQVHQSASRLIPGELFRLSSCRR